MITVNLDERSDVMDLVRVIEVNELHDDPDRFAVWVWLTNYWEVKDLSEVELVARLRNLAEVEEDAFCGDHESGAEFAYHYLVELSGLVVPEEIDIFVDWEAVWDRSLGYDFTSEIVYDRKNERHFYVWFNN